MQHRSSAHAHHETKEEGMPRGRLHRDYIHVFGCLQTDVLTCTQDEWKAWETALPAPSDLFKFALSLGRWTCRWGLDGFWVCPLPSPAACYDRLHRFWPRPRPWPRSLPLTRPPI